MLQVDLASLEAGVSHVEESLQKLSDEQLSGQLAVIKVRLGSIGFMSFELEKS